MGKVKKSMFGFAKSFTHAVTHPLNTVTHPLSTVKDVVGDTIGPLVGNGHSAAPSSLPSPMVDAEAYMARDRTRRMVRQAQGRDSTIRTTAAQPYNATQKKLLGS